MIRTENLRSQYIQDDVEQYLYELLPPRDAVITEIEDYAAKNRVPIIGPAVARLLTLLVQVSGAKRIFEMGSAIGYSTIWLARAAGPKAEVFYTDGDPEKARRAQDYFRRAGVAKRIKVQTGDAIALHEESAGKIRFHLQRHRQASISRRVARSPAKAEARRPAGHGQHVVVGQSGASGRG